MKKITVENESDKKEYLIPHGRQIYVQEGYEVRAGDRLTDGPINPHDILRVKGINEVQEYLVDQIQEIYRMQGVRIDDKHIEVIVRQMLQKVKVDDPGDTNFLQRRERRQDRPAGGAGADQGRGRKARDLSAAAPRDHQGLALDPVVRGGGLLPGDDPDPDRGFDQRGASIRSAV